MIIKMFMKGRTHLPVVFTQPHFISKMGSRHTLKEFMKERNHLTATFYLKIGLKHHIESVHEGEKIACAVCSSAFSTKQHLNRHMMMLFMKGKNHLLVLSALQHFLKKYLSISTLKLFMKGRNHMFVLCALQHFLQKAIS